MEVGLTVTPGVALLLGLYCGSRDWKSFPVLLPAVCGRNLTAKPLCPVNRANRGSALSQTKQFVS